MEATTNRRQFHRYHTPEGTFAVISPEHGTLGIVKDVSKGGLFFEYIAFESPKEVFKAGSKRAISIFRSGPISLSTAFLAKSFGILPGLPSIP